MKLALNTLPRGRSEQIFDSIDPLQKDASIEWQPLELKLVLSVDRQDQNVYLRGHAECTGIFICEAGMEAFKDTLKGDFDLLLTYRSDYLDDFETEEIIQLAPHQVEFDIYPILRETLLLSIPISHVCGPDCEAGKALQEKIKPPEAPDERWDKLKDLFNE